MKYTLDKNEIKRKINVEIKKLENNNLSDYEKNVIYIDIDVYNELLIDLFNQNPKPRPVKKQEFYEQACDISANLLTPTQRSIYKSTFPFLDRLEELNYFEIEIPNNILTINDQKELILDNFIMNKRVRNEINKLFDPKSKKLNITHKKNKNLTYPLFNGECYLSCTNKNDVLGFISLCHEIGHYYEHYFTNNRINKLVFLKEDNIYDYKEVSSIFFELISLKILFDNNLIDENQYVNILKKTKYDDFRDPSIWLIFDEIRKAKKISNKDFHNLKKEFNELYDATIYSYSYIIAVNLFEQFIENEKDAFKNLNYLISNISTRKEKETLNYCDIKYDDTKLFERHIKRMEK